VRQWKTKVDYINILAALGDYLIKNWQAEIFLIPFQISQDLNICLKIKEIMQNKVQILDNLKGVEEYLEFIGELDYLAAMRLHALIFALINQIPMIGIAYDSKVKNFLNEIGAPYLEIEELDLTRIINLFEDLKRNNQKFKEILNKKFLDLKIKAKNNAYLVKKLINF
ncbi:MAG: polysaccharide pyruvyl transferase family protein, partial [Armatimonadetes bacterium]|nr:polysaccharide pyruvyl transferase family protein [Armatimonadota bacterium]